MKTKVVQKVPRINIKQLTHCKMISFRPLSIDIWTFFGSQLSPFNQRCVVTQEVLQLPQQLSQSSQESIQQEPVSSVAEEVILALRTQNQDGDSTYSQPRPLQRQQQQHKHLAVKLWRMQQVVWLMILFIIYMSVPFRPNELYILSQNVV